LNLFDTVTGHVQLAELPGTHGFARRRSGATVIFDRPGSIETISVGINDAGRIGGW